MARVKYVYLIYHPLLTCLGLTPDKFRYQPNTADFVS